MTANDTWWVGQLEEVSRQASAYLRKRFPRIGEAHEDIASEARAQLAEQITKNPASYPRSWFGPGPATGTEDHSYFFQLAHTILRRRIADHFRTQTLAWARETDLQDAEQTVQSADAPHDRRLTISRLFRLCVEFIAELPPEDQMLISRLTGESAGSGLPLTAAERQRVHRLRERLAADVKKRLGEPVSTLLREE
jgi:hypothetical protein